MAFRGGALSFLDGPAEARHQIGVQFCDQQVQAILAALGPGVLPKNRDGSADAVASHHQFKAFARMHALMERNLKNRVVHIVHGQAVDGVIDRL